MCFFIKKRCNFLEKVTWHSGQGTVEAAILIPVMFVLVLLLLQPAIVFYDLIVMKSAAAECCRLVATSDEGDLQLVEDFLRRRLSAIPQAEIFHAHAGGCSYDFEIEGLGESCASVKITNKLKPLPLIDISCKALGATSNDGCLFLEASSSQQIQAGWVK